MSQTYEAYQDTESNWGGYQYIGLDWIVNRVLRETTDQDSLFANIRRSKIVDVAKDGVRVVNREVKRHLKAVEITVPPSQYFALPQDYIDWQLVSVVSDNFRLHTLSKNNNIPMARGFLQADTYELLFDGNGNVLEADASNMFNKPHRRYFCQPSDYMVPGEFNIYEERGVIAFSSDMVGKEFILSYYSDGLENDNLSDTEIKVHKSIQDVLYHYVLAECIRTRKGPTQGDKRAFRDRYKTELHNARVAALELDMQKVTNSPSREPYTPST